MVVIILCIGTSLTVTINDFLDECNRSYTTTAVFEYMGADYPDELGYNPYLDESYENFNSEVIASNPAVKQWDSTEVALGYIEGTKRLNYQPPYKQNAVIVVHVTNYKEDEGVYKGDIKETLYSYKDTEGLMVYINTNGRKLEVGKYYIIHGEFYFGRTSYMYIKCLPFQNSSAILSGFNGTLDKMIEDVSSKSNKYHIPEDSYFRDIANTYSVINNSVTVHATNNLDALLPFQQGTLYLVEGRDFTKEDYLLGAKVCLISEELADILNAKVGDQLKISMAIQKGSAQNDSYWAKTGFSITDNFTIIGLTNLQKDYRQDIFIPKSNEYDLSDNHFTYTLAQVELYNDKASKFVEEITPKLQDRIRMTIYDQGYASATKSLKDVFIVAVLITVVCFLVCVAVLLLFGFLFIYRQRETAAYMHRLGTGKKNIFRYFIFGSAFVSFVAVVTGIVISNGVIDQCMELVRHIVSQYMVSDLNYSNSGFSTLKTMKFDPEIRTDTLFLAGGLVFLLAMCSCILFTVLSIKSRNHTRRKMKVRGRVVSSSLHGGPWKYMWLSIKRGQGRTCIPVIVTACGVMLLFQLTYTMSVYHVKLDEMNKSSDIRGYLTDIDGKQVSGLNIDEFVVNNIAKSSYISDISVTKSCYYSYLGNVSNLDTSALVVETPGTPFAMETLFERIAKGASAIFTNNLATVPEFYYSSEMQISFDQGYDSSAFAKEAGDILYCIISTEFMEVNHIKLGDIIEVLLSDGYAKLISKRMQVIGSYVKAGKLDNIYCQLGEFTALNSSLKGDFGEALFIDDTFDSLHFKVISGEKLPDLKEYLSREGYSQVNKISLFRSFIVIEDKEFLTTKNAMSQRVLYIDRIFPTLYLLVELIAVLIPFLLIQLRKREIAMMRGQGTSKSISFLNVFLEQSVLVIVGGIVGTLISLLIFMRYNTTGFILTVIFATCWLIGAIISIMQINRCSVQSILKAEE
jgi:ABC-type lipoprotein release transport system permease subunit